MLKLRLLQALLLLAPIATSATPLDWVRKASFTVHQGVQDQAWLWGWAWGPDSSVAIVDRSPPLTFAARPAGFGAEVADPLLGYVIPLNAFAQPCEEGFAGADASYSGAMDMDVRDRGAEGRRSSNRQNATADGVLGSEERNLGCPPLCIVGSNVPAADEPWIALVQRGECQFVAKAREAQRLGAKAVVVGGDDPARSGNPDVLVNMYSPGDADDVTIAATFIRFSDYAALYALIAASNTSHSGLKTLSMLISSEYSPWQWYSPIVTFVTILFIPSMLTFFTLLVHRIRAARAAARERAPVDVVHGLPWRVWTGSAWEKHAGEPGSNPNPDAPAGAGACVDVERGEGPSADDGADPAWFESQVECIICLEDFAKGDRVRVLPCKHIFHLKEVDEWLIQRKKVCPICKADVTKPVHSSPPHGSHPADSDATHPTPTSPANERTPLLLHQNAADDS